MNKLKRTMAQAKILLAALVVSIFETLLIAVGVGVVAALATIVLPVVCWVGNAVAAKAKLKLIR